MIGVDRLIALAPGLRRNVSNDLLLPQLVQIGRDNGPLLPQQFGDRLSVTRGRAGDRRNLPRDLSCNFRDLLFIRQEASDCRGRCPTTSAA